MKTPRKPTPRWVRITGRVLIGVAVFGITFEGLTTLLYISLIAIGVHAYTHSAPPH
jgi:hypothetical protein